MGDYEPSGMIHCCDTVFWLLWQIVTPGARGGVLTCKPHKGLRGRQDRRQRLVLRQGGTHRLRDPSPPGLHLGHPQRPPHLSPRVPTLQWRWIVPAILSPVDSRHTFQRVDNSNFPSLAAQSPRLDDFQAGCSGYNGVTGGGGRSRAARGSPPHVSRGAMEGTPGFRGRACRARPARGSRPAAAYVTDGQRCQCVCVCTKQALVVARACVRHRPFPGITPSA